MGNSIITVKDARTGQFKRFELNEPSFQQIIEGGKLEIIHVKIKNPKRRIKHNKGEKELWLV